MLAGSVSAFFTWPVLVTLAAGMGTVYLISYLLSYRDKPGAEWFLVTLVAQAVFCFSYALALTVFDPQWRETLEMISWIGLAWTPVPFLGFALGYTGRGQLVKTWAYRSLFVFPLSVTFLLPFNSTHGLFWTSFEVQPLHGAAGATIGFEPFAYVVLLGGTAPAGIAFLLLFETVLSYGPLYRGEALAVALSPFPPILGMIPWIFGFGPVPQFNTAALLFGVHVLLDAYAFVGSGMFKFQPATNRAAERSALEDLRSPVLVVDTERRVVGMNRAAEELFGVDQGEATTRPVAAVAGRDFDPGEDERHVTWQQDGQPLEFRVELSPLTDSGDNHVGYTLLFQDVTEEMRREQRLSVLNRVLRHNLRNDLTVARGYISESARQSEESDIAGMLERADQRLQELTATGETAREIERTVGGSDTHRKDVELGTFLADLLSEVESAHPDATVTVAGEETIETNPGVLQSVLEELVTNAIHHHDGGKPEITVAVEETGTDSIAITVSDDGPGIPEHELEALKQDQETALRHGSGLGLWLVKWGVVRLAGDLSFETDENGTRVTITLPVEDEADAGPATVGIVESVAQVRTDGADPPDSGDR